MGVGAGARLDRLELRLRANRHRQQCRGEEVGGEAWFGKSGVEETRNWIPAPGIGVLVGARMDIVEVGIGILDPLGMIYPVHPSNNP